MPNYKNDAAVIPFSIYDAIESIPDVKLQAKAYHTLISNALNDTFEKTGDTMVDMVLTMARPVQISTAQKYQRARENGSKGGRPRTIDRATVLELQARGYTQNQMAKKLKCHVNSIYNILNEEPTITYNNLEEEAKAEPEPESEREEKVVKGCFEFQKDTDPSETPF